MNLDNLITMANRIGDFFESMPDHDEALRGISEHIHKFWEPRMRKEILAALDTSAAAAMHPMVIEALQRARAELTPA